jgi:hypothetical protein
MRTLKKTLCLVLALALCFSLASVAFASNLDSYTDAESVTYTEAVDVLMGMGIVKGDTETTINPQGDLTREQAAKLVTYAAVGETVAEKLSATSDPFDDVAATRWSAGYISYCVSAGIINGDGNGKFRPTDKVTGYEFAKMMLCVLGYGKNDEYTGKSWSVNVAKDALSSDINLFDGVLVAANNDPINREEAFQVVFNTITGPETVVFSKDTESYKDDTNKTTLAVDVFGYKKEVTTTDSLGRPYVEYNNGLAGAKKVVYATVEATPVLTSNTVVSADELYNTLGYAATIVSGKTTTTSTADTYVKADLTSANATITVSDKTVALGGNGITTEIYATSTPNVYTVVQIRPTAAKVAAPVNTAATATTGAFTTYTVAGVALKEYTSVVNKTADVTNFTTDSALAKDDIVLVYGNATAGYTVTHATQVTGTVTGYSSKAGTWTIGGAAYPVSAAIVNGGTVDVAAGAIAVTNTSGTYVVDAYGNVFGGLTPAAVTNYVFVLAATTKNYLDSTTNAITPANEATVITTDGALSTITMTNSSDGFAAGLYTYTVNAKGVYTLTSAAAAVTKVAKNDPEIATGKYANAGTKFFVATKDATTGAYTGVTSYTGYANVPTLTLTKTVDEEEVAIATGYIDANGDNVAEIVFVDAASEAGTATTYAYLNGSYTLNANNQKVYDAIVDGKEVEGGVIVASGYTTAGLYNVTAAGVATLQSGSTKYMTYDGGLFKTCATVDGTYSVDSTYSTISATVPVYTFANGACTTSTAADLSASGSTNVTIVHAAVNGVDTITAIYIVK